MKNSIFSFIALTFVFAITSCFTDFDRQSIYEQIAKDEAYEIQHESTSKLALLVATDQIDLEALTQYISENSKGTGKTCDLDDGVLEQIKGGLEYKSLRCKATQAQNILKEKYPEYADFSKSEIQELRNVYKKKMPSPSETIPSVIIQNHIHNN